METVEVVIKIPKNYYDAFKNAQIMTSGMRSGKTYFQILVDALCDGTVLPKGHGALKDYHGIRSEYIRRMSITMSTEFRMSLLCGIIDDAPTVIEADREVEG